MRHLKRVRLSDGSGVAVGIKLVKTTAEYFAQ